MLASYEPPYPKNHPPMYDCKFFEPSQPPCFHFGRLRICQRFVSIAVWLVNTVSQKRRQNTLARYYS